VYLLKITYPGGPKSWSILPGGCQAKTHFQQKGGYMLIYRLAGRGLIGLSNSINRLVLQKSVNAKELFSDDDLSILQSHFKKHDGTELPIDYLKSGKSYVFVNALGEAVAGFALIDTGPLRTLEQIPVDLDADLISRISERTAVFSKVGSGIQRFRFWSFVIGTALASDSQFIIYAVDADKPTLRKNVFNYIRTKVVYEGPVTMLAGMTKQTIEAVELASKLSLSRGFVFLAVLEALKFKG
jgi:hypothetical protein